jgi:hypothetical protein
MAFYVALAALPGVAVLGWIAGMCTFTRSRRWCPTCGQTLTCVSCPGAASAGRAAGSRP